MNCETHLSAPKSMWLFQPYAGAYPM